MSLAPQRPNFVLVWIGIILLTFSFLSNFFAGASSKGDNLAIGWSGKSEKLISAPDATLPIFFSPTTDLLDSAELSLSGEVTPLDFLSDFGNRDIPLAKQAVSPPQDTESLIFPVELLEPAVAQELDAAVATKSLPLPPSTPVQNHALRHFAGAGVGSSGSGNHAPSAPQSQQANFSGTNLSLHELNGKLQGLAQEGGSGVRIKAKLESVEQSNTVLVRFFLSQPRATAPLTELRSAAKINPELLTEAKKYMRVVLEATAEELETDPNSEPEMTKAILRRDLIRLLRLHPGGLEIIAEMTPAQLRELAYKLDARSQGLRALGN